MGNLPITGAVLGGDQRQHELVRQLSAADITVKTYGLKGAAGDRRTDAGTLENAVRDANFLVAPVAGIDHQGRVRSADPDFSCTLTLDVLELVAPGGVVYAGAAAAQFADWCSAVGLRLVEYRESDEFAILNSIPTAEGAVQMAMERMPVTIWGCQAGVIGMGRTGDTLARTLKALGANVTVAARSARERARATVAGCSAVTMAELPEAVRNLDVLFNTAPALVVTSEVLREMRPDSVVIDLASKPGGVDFRAAETLGIKAVLAPGLPGLVAPVTAGRIVARLLLADLFARGLLSEPLGAIK